MERVKVKKNIAIILGIVLVISIAIFVVALLFNVTDYGITIASFAATVFMILSRKSISSRKIFGSYIVATIVGYIFSRISMATLNVAVASVISFVIMTVLEFQHPPALGMSMALVLNKFSLWTDIVILLCIIFILGLALLLKQFLDDPHKVINFVEIEEEKIKWNLPKRDRPSYIEL